MIPKKEYGRHKLGRKPMRKTLVRPDGRAGRRNPAYDEKVRVRRPHAAKGRKFDEPRHRVLTDEQVLAISKDERKPLKVIAYDYGCSLSAVWEIKNGYAWSDLTGIPKRPVKKVPLKRKDRPGINKRLAEKEKAAKDLTNE